jgi:hypothetical protein
VTTGDSSEWDGFIESGGVATVLGLALDAWQHISLPAHDELEVAISIRLYTAMVKKQDRQLHRFLIRYEDVEVDTDLARETGRKDIVFFPGHDGNYYYCLEAKRLNARIDGVMKSLADEYVKEGMQRFVDGKYSRHVFHSGMIGYVLDGDVSRAMANVLNNIQKHHTALAMDVPGNWADCPHRPDDQHAKETEHQRRGATRRLHLQHLFVTAVSDGESGGQPTKGAVRKFTPRKMNNE